MDTEDIFGPIINAITCKIVHSKSNLVHMIYEGILQSVLAKHLKVTLSDAITFLNRIQFCIIRCWEIYIVKVENISTMKSKVTL